MRLHMSNNTSNRRRNARRRAALLKGFTLVEILIVVVILGILATIVLPQFSNASATARENTLKDELRYLGSRKEPERDERRPRSR